MARHTWSNFAVWRLNVLEIIRAEAQGLERYLTTLRSSFARNLYQFHIFRRNRTPRALRLVRDCQATGGLRSVRSVSVVDLVLFTTLTHYSHIFL